MTDNKPSSGYNGTSLFHETIGISARMAAKDLGLTFNQNRPVTFANSVNAFLRGDNIMGAIGLNHIGSATVALTELETTEYEFRVARERGVELALTDGPNFDQADPDAITTIVARANKQAVLRPGMARLETKFNPSTGFSNITLLAKGETEVFGAVFQKRARKLRAERPSLDIHIGPYRVLVDGFAMSAPTVRSIASSSALPGNPVEDEEITSINEVTVTAVDFGFPQTSVARFDIEAGFHALEGRDESGELVYAGYYIIALPAGVTIDGFVAEAGYPSNLAFVQIDGQEKLVWTVGWRQSLAESIANTTTKVLGTKIIKDLDGILTANQGTLQPTAVAAKQRKPHPPKPCPEPIPCPPKPIPCRPKPVPCHPKPTPCPCPKPHNPCKCGRPHPCGHKCDL
jgi:hypothetical protein